MLRSANHGAWGIDVTARTDIPATLDDRNPKVGEEITLTAYTPDGLLKNRECKYLITGDGRTRFALALEHSCLPPFTWIALCEIESDWGEWIGPYRIHFTHKTSDYLMPTEPGAILVDAGGRVIECVTYNNAEMFLPLRRVRKETAEQGVYDGWQIEAVATSQLFFERRPYCADAEK